MFICLDRSSESDSEGSGVSVIIIAVSVVAAVGWILLIIVVAGVIWYKRKRGKKFNL